MKKKSLVIILAICISLLHILSSCAYSPLNSTDEQYESLPQDTSTLTDVRIKELEAKIVTLLQSQQISESERKKEISTLKAELEALKKKESEKSTEASTESNTQKVFDYTLNGYKVTITAINTDEESISIPAIIDGHAVVGIGSEVLKSKNIKRIVLEDGIETLDWFAFKGCSALSSISIPASVTSIGYGAFDGASKALTIECKKDSFAMKYAQSYGIKYVLKK